MMTTLTGIPFKIKIFHIESRAFIWHKITNGRRKRQHQCGTQARPQRSCTFVSAYFVECILIPEEINVRKAISVLICFFFFFFEMHQVKYIRSCHCSVLIAILMTLNFHLDTGTNDPSIHYNKQNICLMSFVSVAFEALFSQRPMESLSDDRLFISIPLFQMQLIWMYLLNMEVNSAPLHDDNICW